MGMIFCIYFKLPLRVINLTRGVSVYVSVATRVVTWQAEHLSKAAATKGLNKTFRVETYHLIYLNYFYSLQVTYYIFLKLIFKK